MKRKAAPSQKTKVATTVAATLAAATLSACAARYQTIHKGQAGGEGGDQPPESSDANPDSPKDPVDQAKPVGPSAAIEALLDGKRVTQVRVGQEVTLRPTKGTMDPDDRAKADECRNPGIVKAAYDVGAAVEKVVERSGSSDCGSLATTATFAEAGKKAVVMIVTSNEGETAKAKLTLVVVAGDTPDDQGGPDGFIVDATPTVAEVDEKVTFTGTNCDGDVTWDFKDGSDGKGTPAQHGYAKAGAYEVVGTCELKDGSGTLEGKVTVAVVPGDEGVTTSTSTSTATSTSTSTATSTSTSTSTATSTSTSTSTSTPTSTSTGTGEPDDGDDPGQHPGQHPGQGPGQGPGQTPFQGKS